MEDRLQNQLQSFIKTPALWKDKDMFDLEQFKIPSFTFPEALSIEEQLPSLETNYVFGKRMENYFELLLKFSEDWEILEKNIQIQKNKITIGELDFLLKDLNSEEKIYHVELVFKFYIYNPSFGEEADKWIGPNRRDSLVQKIGKLKQRQFPLIFHPETQNRLNHLNLSKKTVEQRVCFKAQLFLPKKMKIENFNLINKDCICGYWIRMEQFSSEEYGEHFYALPQKQDWAVHPHQSIKETWIPFSEVLENVRTAHSKKQSPLLWIKKGNFLFEKFFVVWW